MAIARATITGVPRTPNPYGLLSVVTPREPADPHWQNGVQWEAPPCRNPGIIGNPDCNPDTATVGLPKGFGKSGPVLNTADPFTVYVPYRCSPVGRTVAEAQEMATQQLLAEEQTEIEWEVWSGHTGADTNLPAAAEAATAGPLDPVAALSALESWYHGHYGTVNGQLGYIHMGVSAATILASQDLLRYSGNTVTTPAGSRVIIGTGYGAATELEDGSVTDRIYITPPPFIYRSEIFTSSNREGDLLNRSNNQLSVVAERTYLVGWDSCPTSYYADMRYPDAAGTDLSIPFKIRAPEEGASYDWLDTITVWGTAPLAASTYTLTYQNLDNPDDDPIVASGTMDGPGHWVTTTGLPAGQYELTATDDLGDSDTVTFTVTRDDT